MNTSLIYLSPVLVMPLGLLTIRRYRRKSSIEYALYLLLAVIACILCTELHGLLYSIPPFNHFRWPFKHMLFLSFFLCVFAALTSKAIRDHGASRTLKGMYTITVLSLVLNVIVVFHNPTVTMAHFRAGSALQKPLQNLIDPLQGRVVTYQVSQPSPPEYIGYPAEGGHRYLTFVYATLFEYFHLGGQDPLVSRMHKDLSLGAQYINSYEKELTPKVLDHWTKTSVRFVLTSPTTEHRNLVTEFPQLKLLFEDSTLMILENEKAYPFAYPCSDATKRVPIKYSANSVFLDTSAFGKIDLCLTLAPSSNFQIQPGLKMHLQDSIDFPLIRLEIPSEVDSVKLHYRDFQFLIGTALFFATVVILILIRFGVFHGS